MNFYQIKPLLNIFFVSICAFATHKFLVYFFGFQFIESGFQYSIFCLYFCFMISTMVIILLLILVKQKTIDNVGYTFMGLTLFKMGICYIFLKPILNSSNKFIASEKINFFAIFMLYLVIETLFAIRILNNKQ